MEFSLPCYRVPNIGHYFNNIVTLSFANVSHCIYINLFRISEFCIGGPRSLARIFEFSWNLEIGGKGGGGILICKKQCTLRYNFYLQKTMHFTIRFCILVQKFGHFASYLFLPKIIHFALHFMYKKTETLRYVFIS